MKAFATQTRAARNGAGGKAGALLRGLQAPSVERGELLGDEASRQADLTSRLTQTAQIRARHHEARSGRTASDVAYARDRSSPC